MVMKRNLLIIFIFCLPTLIFSQQTIPVTLDWSALETQRSSSSLEINYLSFNEAANIPEFGALPVFSAMIALPDELFGCELNLEIKEFDTLSTEISLKLTDAELLTDSIFYQFIYNYKTANLLLVPLYKIEGTELIARVKEFTAKVTFFPKTENPKQLSVRPIFADNSVLSSGTWLKMGVLNTGVHKISYSDIEKMGLVPEQLDLNKIGIFGNYTGMLSEENSKPRTDDLQENAIMIVGGEDGQFSQNDYLLFYGRSAVNWKYNIFTGRIDHTNNLYSDTTYYFFTPDRGNHLTIENEQSTAEQATQQLTTFLDYAVHDNDHENIISSGKEWFGEQMTGDTMERTFNFYFPNINTHDPVYLDVDMIGRGLIYTYYEVYVNGELVIDSARFQKLSVGSAYHAYRTNKKVTFFADQDQLEIKVRYITDDPTTIAWLNYIELNVKRKLIFPGGQMAFREPHISAAGNITQFIIEGNATGAMVWDITDAHHPKNIEYQVTDGSMQFRIPTDSLKEFIVFDNTSYYTPVSYAPAENQNLHGTEQVNLVIISPPVFLSQANRIAAIHESNDGLKTLVVTPQQIYNEFSSGSQDIAAIRDYIRMLKLKGAFGDDNAYLMMFGDASFDYKHRIRDNTNFIPTYQSLESLRETGSFVTDDFFGLLDDGEGSNSTGNLDIGIGRLPVVNLEQASNAVDKIDYYISRNLDNMGSWRNNFCFVADDKDKNLHLEQANSLIDIADTLNDGVHINKIFSDAYTKIKIPGRTRYPEVNEQIKKQVNEGTLIMNYTGHGGLIGWSEEMIFDVPTIRAFTNKNNMPLFITATCEFSRFDDPEFLSAGEYLFLNKNGGSIALMTTTRLAYAHANIVVNRRIYENLMVSDKGVTPRLGDLVRISKIPSNVNYLNFVLLGDPAMKLAFPENNVVTEMINRKITGSEADTVHALSEVNISGYIQDLEGNKMSNFNGYLYPKVYDKPSKYRTLGNDFDSYKVDFYLSDNVLFDGKISVSHGEFNFSFLVPRDIAYNYGFGEIKYYAVDTINFADAWGGYKKILIGGMDQNAENDNTGPEIKLYLNNKNFQNGQVTTGHPLLLAELNDDFGISCTGQSLGRDLVLTIDNNQNNSIIVNDFFDLNVDTYKNGSLAYQLEGLEKGWHQINLKAWDLLNNSSEKSIDFYVDDQAQIVLSEVINYPNPFLNETNFGFIHNKNGSILNVKIMIYDIHGRFIGSIDKNLSSEGSQIAPLTWNGCNQNGSKINPGVYTYQLIVTDQYGNQTVQVQKMIKLSE